MTNLPPYWTNPLESTFRVKVKVCNKNDDHYEVVLFEDVIRPAGGGQAGDRGFLKFHDDEAEILDCIMKDKQTVLIVNSFLDGGKQYSLEIDMNWRKAMMQNHTAQHLLVSSLKMKHKDISVRQLWIDGDHGSVEILGDEISFEDILDAEKHVNQLILDSIEVTSEIIDSSSIDSSIRARDGATKHEEVRIVRIGKYDASACSGIHVSNTSDIFIFKIIDSKIQSDGVQVEFITGERAVRDLCQIYNMALRRKDSFPFEIQQLGAIIDKCKWNSKIHEQLLDNVQTRIHTTPNIKRIGDSVLIHEYLPGFNSARLREIVRKIKFDDPSALFLFIPGKKCNFIFRTDRMPYDAKDYIQDSINELGGKGGGSGDVYTGGFSDVENPKEIYNKLVNSLTKKLRVNKDLN